MSRKAEGPQATAEVDEELLSEEHVIDLDERAEILRESEPVNYFGSDFDVHGLVRRLNQEEIIIPTFDPPPDSDISLTGFQRGFVWRKYQMDRFVESLLLGYPVPGIFLVQEPDKRLLVLDGQQRLRTLQAYYRGIYGKEKEFILENVARRFQARKYEALDPVDRRTLDNTLIHATVVRYDASLKGRRAIYELFERLNSGGTNLYPQEIRVALYNGELVELLRDLNRDPAWRELYGPQSGRLKDQELILRYISFQYSFKSYQRPLKQFLNDFLSEHRRMRGLDEDDIRRNFTAACGLILNGIGRKAFRTTNQVNAALVDAVMFGITARLRKGPITESSALDAQFKNLVADAEFLSAIARATADEERVRARLTKSEEAFSRVP